MNNKASHLPISENDLAPFVQPSFLSIGWHFVIYFLLISLLPISIVGYFIISNSQFELKNQIQSKLESIAILKISQLQYWIDDKKQDFKSLLEDYPDFGSLSEQMFADKTNESRDLLRNKMNQISQSRHFLELFFIDSESGKVLVSTNTRSEGLDTTNKDYFIQGKKGFFEGKVYYSEDLSDNALTVSMPIKNNDEKILGILAADIDLNVLYNFLSDKVGLGKTGEIYMVSRFYKRIPSFNFLTPQTDKQNPPANKTSGNEKLIYSEGVIRALQGETGLSIYKNYDNKDVIGYFQFFSNLGLVFLVEQSADEALHSISSIGNTLFIVFLIILIADIALALIIAKNIRKPLKNLIDSAKRVQRGDFTVFADTESNDEFGVLANALNKMAESLIFSLSETKNIINTMPNALFILDTKGKIQSANQAAIDLTDFSKEELIGKDFKNIARLSDAPDGSHRIFNFDRIIKEETVTDMQLNCFTNSHLTIPISLSGTILKDRNKKLTGFIIILQDLRKIKEYAKKRLQKITPLLHKISLGDFTEKIQIPSAEDEFTDLLISLGLMTDNLRELIKENQLQTSQIRKSKEKTEEEKAKAEALLGSIGEGIVAIDLEGKIMLMNPEAENMFGKLLPDVVGTIYFNVFNFEDEKGKKILPDSLLISEVVSHKKQIHTITYFIKQNGEKLPLSTNISPILFENKTLGVIGTFRDITKEMEIDKAKSEFVSLASHQLRTPLAGINWLLQEIRRKGNLDNLQTEYLNDAMSSSDRMVRLVNDLLNVSRLETGIIKVNYTETNLPDFIEEFVKEARFIAKTKNQKIQYDKPSQKIMISLDRDLIGQVISNLLSNAINYSNKDKTISVSIKTNNNEASILIKDEGIGISNEDQKKLFVKFFRSKDASKYSTTGSGLGLYIIKKILDICCGKIQCSSAEGKGTTFTVILPLSCQIVPKGRNQIIRSKMI